MQVPVFELERFQSLHEHRVDINLTESGVEPLEAGELLGPDPAAARVLLEQRLGYTQTNGTPELRAAIAATRPGATEHEVLVTNGGAEANFVTCWRLLEPGDEAVVMQPNYGQVRGLAEGFGAIVRPWPLREDRSGPAPRWAPDLDELSRLVTDRTRLVAICNPNNPTGARLTEAEVAAVCEIADRHGAWVLSDEVYRGVERDGVPTPSAWRRAERVIVTGGLSKAYGLPGLRIGWLLCPRAMAGELWSRRDYTTIAPSALSDLLARHALAPSRARRLLARARRLVDVNFRIVNAWLDSHAGSLTWVPPEAGAMAFIRYEHDIGSTALADRLRKTEGVLVVPGDHFGLDGHLRLGFGGRSESLCQGLERIDRMLGDLPLRTAHRPAGTGRTG
jgi:hypothetical protein